MKEMDWDKLLHIKTTGRDATDADTYRYPYEPTPYPVLERLAAEIEIGKKNTLLDYGCGKGRVGLYLAYQTKCQTIGIEYNSRIFERAIQNKESSVSGKKAEFICEDAREYQVPAEVDRIFFFNPFSVEILRSVMKRIQDSYYENPRNIKLFFYYPSEEYVVFLMQEPMISFVDEIDCTDLFNNGDDRERILCYEF